MGRIKEKKWFRLHHGIVPVRGKDHSAVYDFNAKKLSMISNDLYDLIEWLQRFGSDERPGACPVSQERLMEWLSGMLADGWGHLTHIPHRFRYMPTEWHGYTDVHQAVVDHSLGNGSYSLEDVIGQLDDLMCEHLELRLSARWDEDGELDTVISALRDAEFSSVHLVLRFREGVETGHIFDRCQLLARITFYGAPMDGKSRKGGRKVRYRTGTLDSLARVPAMLLVLTRSFFSEAQKFNPYYHRRVTVDSSGFIRNDLGLKSHFGNVGERPIKEAVRSDEFRELWLASADKIVGLQDDPFRYAALPMVELARDERSGFYRIVGEMPEFHFR